MVAHNFLPTGHQKSTVMVQVFLPAHTGTPGDTSHISLTPHRTSPAPLSALATKSWPKHWHAYAKQLPSPQCFLLTKVRKKNNTLKNTFLYNILPQNKFRLRCWWIDAGQRMDTESKGHLIKTPWVRGISRKTGTPVINTAARNSLLCSAKWIEGAENYQ